jgi:hypothetical protein
VVVVLLQVALVMVAKVVQVAQESLFSDTGLQVNNGLFCTN